MSSILFPLLTLANKKFRKGNYESVLRGFKTLYSNNDKYSCYVNLHRIASLILTNNDNWEKEYSYIIEKKQLNLLGGEDIKYIKLYLSKISAGLIKSHHKMDDLDMAKVSTRTKKYFPLM